MRTVSLASSHSCSIDCEAWCKRALIVQVINMNTSIFPVTTPEFIRVLFGIPIFPFAEIWLQREPCGNGFTWQKGTCLVNSDYMQSYIRSDIINPAGAIETNGIWWPWRSKQPMGEALMCKTAGHFALLMYQWWVAVESHCKGLFTWRANDCDNVSSSWMQCVVTYVIIVGVWRWNHAH